MRTPTNPFDHISALKTNYERIYFEIQQNYLCKPIAEEHTDRDHTGQQQPSRLTTSPARFNTGNIIVKRK